MEEKSPRIRIHIWLETEDGLFFGEGRAQLLEGIEIHGSLKKAAEHLGMSYRAAWGKIKATEANVGVSLIEKKAGKRSGYCLTKEGRRLMAQYESWFAQVEDSAYDLARKIFPFTPRRYTDAFG